MATQKFKEASPYTQKCPEPPPEDYLYKKYLQDIAQESQAKEDLVLNVAIFGLGRAGTIHIKNIIRNPRTKLVYIVDDVESKWGQIKRYWHLNDVTFLNSKQSDRVFEDPTVDISVVASPTFTHEQIVSKSLEAKKAVFCEKPVAQEVESIKKCYGIAKQVGKPLFCAFNRRFDPSYIALRDNVRKGDIGHVHTIKTVSRDSPLPSIEYLSTCGTIFHDCMVHDIDLMTWILGEYPDKIFVGAHSHIPEIKALNDFDTVAGIFQFTSGTLGMIDLSRNSNYGYDMRLEAFGSKGMINANNERPLSALHSQYGLSGPQEAPIYYYFASRFKIAYHEEFKYFLDVVEGNKKVPVDLEQILAVNKIASACEESAMTGKMIELKWKQDEISSTI